MTMSADDHRQGVGGTLLSHAETRELNAVESAVMKTLMYFRIFHYPLRADEIRDYLSLGCEPEDIATTLNFLVDKAYISRSGEYFFPGEIESVVQRRVAGNILAEKMEQKAKRYAGIISGFPFVRAVCISGSMSKGYMDSQADIDYFIITKPGKLWIARTLLIAFKKVFLFNSKKYFCLNYFIDTDHLEIPDRNIFTATELATLKPMVNADLIKSFHDANAWADGFLPNSGRKIHAPKTLGNKAFRVVLELLLSNRVGDGLDAWFMKITVRRWKRKFGHLRDYDFDQAMRSRKYVSKHHPQNFQFKVLQRLEEGIVEFEQEHRIKLYHG